MPGGSQNTDPVKEIEVETLALLHAYPVGLRTWGMRITVYGDSAPGNNGTYVLTYNKNSIFKQDNNNWQFEFDAVTRKQRANSLYFEVLLESLSGTAGQVNCVNANEIADGEHLFIEIDWTAKSTAANTGAGGKHICNWTKDAGALVKSFENDTLKNQNMAGAALTVSTVDSGGSIRVGISQAAAPANYTVSWIARVIKRTA